MLPSILQMERKCTHPNLSRQFHPYAITLLSTDRYEGNKQSKMAAHFTINLPLYARDGSVWSMPFLIDFH